AKCAKGEGMNECSARWASEPAIAVRIDSLLFGAIDLHCHSGPSVMPRMIDHIEALEEASAAGMRALLFKDHFNSATPVTALLSAHFSDLGVTMLSGVPLNDTAGGVNTRGVNHGLNVSARL